MLEQKIETPLMNVKRMTRLNTTRGASILKRSYGAVAFSDRLRQPDNLRQEALFYCSMLKRLWRLTALRPHLAMGLPLSCAIVVLRKTFVTGLIEPATSTVIKRYLSMFVNNSILA
jgi:hypothetical protein